MNAFQAFKEVNDAVEEAEVLESEEAQSEAQALIITPDQAQIIADAKKYKRVIIAGLHFLKVIFGKRVDRILDKFIAIVDFLL